MNMCGDLSAFASEDRIFSEDIRQLHAIIHDHSFVRYCDEFAPRVSIRAECRL
jgi:hypothetical protein